jgi:U3 small nucleolar RNA-associated protein 16
MVSATRRGVVASEVEKPQTNGIAKAGKRKTQSTATEKTEDKQSKRRKRDSLEAADASSDDDSEELKGPKKQKSSTAAPKAHFRFDSEEPAMPEVTKPDMIPAAPQDDDEDTDSDDDAPETIDNSAQLLKIKEQAKKQEQQKQQYVLALPNHQSLFSNLSCREEQLKKEKRRKLDERRKLQAKSKPKEIVSSDDLLSESTATLQGSITQDARRAALPALLPDDILNSEPVLRPPTPPAEDSMAPKKSTKLRFLEKNEKPPKDVQVGDVTIRVLDAPSTKKTSKPALAPKASKAGRNVKQSWLQRERSTAKVNGMRMTAGGTSGFRRT